MFPRSDQVPGSLQNGSIIEGKAVLCERTSFVGLVDAGQEVTDNKGAAMILMNQDDDGYRLVQWQYLMCFRPHTYQSPS